MQDNTFTFTAYVIKEQKGFTALCRDVDVATEGLTIQEAKQNLIEAVSLYVESAIENNLPIIRPVPKEDDPTQKKSDAINDLFDLKLALYADCTRLLRRNDVDIVLLNELKNSLLKKKRE